MNTPKAFISYSWDDSPHKTWVKEFASRLRKDGIDTTLDQWHAAPGDQLPTFMEKAVRENDFVLMVCTPKYKAGYDSRNGGAGYEGDIIQGEVFVRNNHRKFIPILRRGNWEEVAPSALLGAYYIDLRDGSGYTNNYQDLLLTLQGQRPKPPDLGTTTSDEPIRWTLILDGICDDSVKSRVEALAKHLQQLLGDSSLTIEKIQQGSVIVHLRGTRTGFEAMKALFESSKITNLDGLKILQICEAGNSEKRGIGDVGDRTFTKMTAQELIAECLRGSAEAWVEFISRWDRVIASGVWRLLSRQGATSRLLVEDLIQDVYLKLTANGFESLRRFKFQDENNFIGFLKVVARNVVADHLRATVGRSANEASESDAPSSFSAGHEAEKVILFEEIDQIIKSSASEQARNIFWLYYRLGLTAKEIASFPSINLSVKGVENILFRLIKLLKLKMSTDVAEHLTGDN